MRTDLLSRLNLDSNPFEPASTGAPLIGDLRPPPRLEERMTRTLDLHGTGEGVKALVVVGEYGSGKTCLLEWLHRHLLPARQVTSFYFDNPGVHFYDLANSLFRQLGRKTFAKLVWELASSHMKGPYQGAIFHGGYEEYLLKATNRATQQRARHALQNAILAAGITGDEEIAHCLGRVVAEAPIKPYFEYSDFVPKRSGSLVAEGEAAPYFRAVLTTLVRGAGARGVAFLVDEFEEVGLQKKLTKRAAHDYFATLKRLINLSTRSEEVDFWIVLSMTPDAYDTTLEVEPALRGRFSGGSGEEAVIRLEPLDAEEAIELMQKRLGAARPPGTEREEPELFPFPRSMCFRGATYSNPRKLVKICSRAIAEADASTDLPFSEDYLRGIEDRFFRRLPDGDAP